MKIIEIKKFGNVLISRPSGLEAFNAIRPQLDKEEQIQLDFSDVLTVTPSWLDEFLTQLTDFNAGKVEILPSKNASLLASLPVLAEARHDYVAVVAKQALTTV